jgi:hypothetical protein
VDVPLPWERVLWSRRAPLSRRVRYALTDFRLVRTAAGQFDELALADITDVERRESWLDGIVGTSTLVVYGRNDRRPPFVLPHVRRGAQLAALIELASSDPHASWSREVVRATMAREPRAAVAGYREAVLSVATMFVAVLLVAVGLHGKTPAVTYPSDDAIAPGGVKRDRESIVRFMESDVMPWARQALGPLMGGADRVTCTTCHGGAAALNEWRMPAVSALPEPDVTLSGWETYSDGMDPQIRNAVYGYAAGSGNQAKATRMREIVMPGMARLLRRPAYDFARSYEYNRTHAAFGCYHCHHVT